MKLRAIMIMSILACVQMSDAMAEMIDSEDIVSKLSAPKPLTRSLSARTVSNLSPEQKETLDRAFSRGIKITVAEKNNVYAVATSANLASIDVTIEFDFGSAKIRSQSLPQLNALVTALSHPKLRQAKVLVVGHTDAKGSDEFNQQLSEKRAHSVVEFLNSQGVSSSERLISLGKGELALKNEHDPLAAENRRVEIINISAN